MEATETRDTVVRQAVGTSYGVEGLEREIAHSTEMITASINYAATASTPEKMVEWIGHAQRADRRRASCVLALQYMRDGERMNTRATVSLSTTPEDGDRGDDA